MTMVNAPSADDLRAAFKFSRFEPIVGKLPYEKILKLEMQGTSNAATVVIHFPWPHKNLSGTVEQPEVYVLRVGSPFPRPPYPGDAANFPVGATILQHQNIQAAYDTKIKNFLTCQTTDNILKSLLENTIEHYYLSGIHSAVLGFGARSLQYIFIHLY